MKILLRLSQSTCLAFLFIGKAVYADPQNLPTLNLSGALGLIDVPSGEAMPDGTFNISVSRFGSITRATMSFQIAPWLGGSFRLQNTKDWNKAPQYVNGFYSSYNDRSFDLRFHVLSESTYVPSVTLGLQDFIGTGISSSEYLTATKSIGDKVKITAGLGWGQLGSYKPIAAPFGVRPEIYLDEEFGYGGKPSTRAWFRGDMSAFGGVEYHWNDRVKLLAEYSSNNYPVEAGLRKTFKRDSPFNFGVEYQWTKHIRVGAYSLYGSELGFSIHMVVDPSQPLFEMGTWPQPVPVRIRPAVQEDPQAWDRGWVVQKDAGALLRNNLDKILERDGLQVEALSYTVTRAQLWVRSSSLDAPAQAIGRSARALAYVMPASVEQFEIIPVLRGFGASRVIIKRSDLEALEQVENNSAELRKRVSFFDAGVLSQTAVGPQEGLYPRFRWRVLPGYRVSTPTRGDLGGRATASYDVRPGWVLSGQVYGRLANNYNKINVLDKCDRSPESCGTLPHVRSDARDYNAEGGLALERLQLAWYQHPAENIYTRVSFGYLERMHAGISSEVLWKRVSDPFAFGVELNYTSQRNRNGGFGFSDYDYSVLTGYVSAYYDFGNGYLGQLDVGRYLAGDYGTTVSLDREFSNGWRLGAFATLTNASSEEFGEGSFDKGLRLVIPLQWVFGNPTQQALRTTIRPIQRDGGARLDVEGRLYEALREYHLDRIEDQWSKVWK